MDELKPNAFNFNYFSNMLIEDVKRDSKMNRYWYIILTKVCLVLRFFPPFDKSIMNIKFPTDKCVFLFKENFSFPRLCFMWYFVTETHTMSKSIYEVHFRQRGTKRKYSTIKLNYRQALKKTNKYFVTIKLQVFYGFRDDWKCLLSKYDVEGSGSWNTPSHWTLWQNVNVCFEKCKVIQKHWCSNE